MKQCLKCGEVFDLSFFYKHSKMLDGHLNHCKECVRSRIRNQSRGNPAVLERERKRNKLPHRRELTRQSLLRRRKARTTVGNAIRDGRLAPASACECNDCREPAAVLHHHSYEPEHLLDVVPLCRSCHGIRHAYPERFS